MTTVGCSPVHQIQRGGVRATVYENLLKGSQYVVSFSRLYQENGQWMPATGYRMGDVILLSMVAVEVYLWLEDRIQLDQSKEQTQAGNVVQFRHAPVCIGKEGA